MLSFCAGEIDVIYGGTLEIIFISLKVKKVSTIETLSLYGSYPSAATVMGRVPEGRFSKK